MQVRVLYPLLPLQAEAALIEDVNDLQQQGGLQTSKFLHYSFTLHTELQ